MSDAQPARKSRGARPLLPEALARRLLRPILSGALHAGDRLPPERELAERLRVNRSSLREALRLLEQLRVIETLRGSGSRVRPLTDASLELVALALDPEAGGDAGWLDELLELRELLLPPVLRLALARAEPAELAALAQALLAASGPRGSDAELGQRLDRLPGELAALSGNRVLAILAQGTVRFVGGAPAAPPADRRALRAPLRRLALALEARDTDSAERAGRDVYRRLRRGAPGGGRPDGADGAGDRLAKAGPGGSRGGAAS